MAVVIPVAVALTLLSAFFSASSTAIFSVGGSRLRTLVEEGFKGAEELSDLRARTGFHQGILLFLGTVANLSVVGIVTGWASLRWGLPGITVALPASGLGVILFAELLPRSLAARRSILVGLAVAPAVLMVGRLFGPFLSPFFRLESLLARAAGEEGATQEEREVREITALGQREGVVGMEEHQLVERAFRLDEMSVWDVMTPRVAIFSWKDSLTLEEIVAGLESVPFSRVPVYGESVDDITGVVYLRDVYQGCIAGKGKTTLKSLSRDPFFVPGSLPLTRLLKDFQAFAALRRSNRSPRISVRSSSSAPLTVSWTTNLGLSNTGQSAAPACWPMGTYSMGKPKKPANPMVWACGATLSSARRKISERTSIQKAA